MNIPVGYMTLIGTWMNSDTICAKTLYVFGSLDNIGNIATSGIAERGYFIDIDAESRHVKLVKYRTGAGFKTNILLLLYHYARRRSDHRGDPTPQNHRHSGTRA